MLRLPFAIAAAVGVGLLALWLATSQPSASRSADEVMDGAAPVVTDAGLARMRADLDKAKAVADAAGAEGLERLAALSGQGRSRFAADLRRRHPGVSEGLTQAGGAHALADRVVSNLERRRGQFESAESLPGLGLSLEDAAWGQLALGLGLLVLGAVGLARPRRASAGAVLLVGLALAVPPLALGNVGKAADTDELLDSLRPFSVEKVTMREDALASARRLFEGYRDDVIPDVAARADLTPAEVTAELAEASPQLSAASLAEIGAILDRFDGLVAFSRRIQPELVEADALSARAHTWLLIGPGAVLVLAGAAGLLALRRGPLGVDTQIR